MKRIDVMKKGDRWVAETGGKPVTSARTKVAAVHKAAEVARRAPEAVSVRIRKMNNQIQEERTYPRKADPRSSKG